MPSLHAWTSSYTLQEQIIIAFSFRISESYWNVLNDPNTCPSVKDDSFGLFKSIQMLSISVNKLFASRLKLSAIVLSGKISKLGSILLFYTIIFFLLISNIKKKYLVISSLAAPLGPGLPDDMLSLKKREIFYICSGKKVQIHVWKHF